MKETYHPLSGLAVFLTLVGVIVLTTALISPPSPLPVDAPADQFSAARAMRDLEAITRATHPMGISEGHGNVVAYLAGAIRELGLEPEIQDTFGVRVVGSGFLVGGMVENIVVRLPGTQPQGAILLTSHYDTVPGSPGAVCSGSGVVAALELLRALQAGQPLRHDVIVLLTDGEEPGTIGAHAFVAQHPWMADVELVLSMDQFRLGPAQITSTSRGNGLWVKALAQNEAATRPGFVSFPFDITPAGDTDLLPFRNAGIRGIDFQTTSSATEVHTTLDLPYIVDIGSMQQGGAQALALVRYLGNQPALAADTPDQTFFPVLGRLIRYPARWAAPLAATATVCFLGVVAFGFRRRLLSWKGAAMGFLVVLAGIVLSAGLAAALWQVIQALHPEYAYDAVGTRTTLSNDRLYTYAFFALALAVMTGAAALARRKISQLDLAAGVLAFWLPVVIALAIVMPASSYVATWLLLCGALALLPALMMQARKRVRLATGLGYLVGATAATILAIPWISIAVVSGALGAQTALMATMVALAAAWIGCMIPILDWISQPKAWLLPAAALAATCGLLVAGHFVVGKDSPPPLVNSVGYWLDADSREASWVAFIGGSRVDAHTRSAIETAFPEEIDERQLGLLTHPVRKPYTDLFPYAPSYSVLMSEAPELAVDGPRMTVTEDTWRAGRRIIDVAIETSMHDRLWIIIPDGQALAGITVPNNPAIELPSSDQWWLRFDGMPLGSLRVSFELTTPKAVEIHLVEEKTGLPAFTGLVTQPAPGTMKLPGEFVQGIAADFTAVYRAAEIEGEP